MRKAEDIAADLVAVEALSKSAGASADALVIGAAIVQGAELVCHTIHLIAEGDGQRPTGLEALSMAIAGPGLKTSLSSELSRIAAALEALAAAKASP